MIQQMLKRLKNQLQKSWFQRGMTLFILVLSIAMNGCDAIYLNELESQTRLQNKEIRVAIQKHPLIFWPASTVKDKSSSTSSPSAPVKGSSSNSSSATLSHGVDYDLLRHFAKTYKLKIRWIAVNSQEEAIEKTQNGEADITAARISNLAQDHQLNVGPALEDTQLSLFCPYKIKINQLDQVQTETILISKTDNYIRFESKALYEYPKANVEVLALSPKEIFQQALQRKNTCAVTETREGLMWMKLYPAMAWIDRLSENFSISWLVAQDNQDLLLLLKAWFQRASREDEIIRVHDRYRSLHSILSRSDVRQFLKNKRELLPDLKKYFLEAAEETQLPWTLIAAIAYQESHWNESARSKTGVRGIMQLTQDTADHLGISDRTDPEESIRGGARYIKYLFELTPKHLHFQDRLSLALSGYNMGWAHVEDAQKLAEDKGLNPNSWKHLQTILPLLADPAYAKDLEYGQARGHEAKDFVERVQAFYTLLRIHE